MGDRHGQPPVRKRDRSQKPTAHDFKRLERALARVGLGVPDADAAEQDGATMNGSDDADDDGENLERMWREIIARVPKAETATIRHAADSALWDKMAQGRDAIVAAGQTPVMDIDTGPDHPGMWIVRTFQAPAEPGETGDPMSTDGDRVPVEPNLEAVFGPDGLLGDVLHDINILCATCELYLGNSRCTAFRGEIPRAIVAGLHDHRKPYPGDHGLRYTPTPGASACRLSERSLTSRYSAQDDRDSVK